MVQNRSSIANKNNIAEFNGDYGFEIAGRNKGALAFLRSLMSHSSIGELLVRTRAITPAQMRGLLKEQKKNGDKLGHLAVKQGLVSPAQLTLILCKQRTIRFAAACMALLLSLVILKPSKARAGAIKDVPALLQVAHTPDYQKYSYLQSYPRLFGMKEVKSSNVKPFDKWTGMFSTFNQQIKNKDKVDDLNDFRQFLKGVADLPELEMIREINSWANSVPYVEDSKNWGKSDYWATPVEFFRKGGDCEDYAIAKYTALRALGWPENRLRLAIVTDLIKGIPHAILIVYTSEGPVILDNQIKAMKSMEDVFRYKPIFSINRHAWWYHKEVQQPEAVIASVQ